LGRNDEARAAYVQARTFAKAEPEVKYLDERLRELA
jgi:Flp pilus assembly protein TadD